MATYKELWVADQNSKERKKVILFLFSDMVIIAYIYNNDRIEYMNHTELNEFSFANDKRDLKYYQNLIKIVGKQHCFILIAKD